MLTSLAQRRLAALPPDTRAAAGRKNPHNRHRGLIEQASDAAVDTDCRVLHLPTMRAGYAATAEAAEREQMTYRGFLAKGPRPAPRRAADPQRRVHPLASRIC